MNENILFDCMTCDFYPSRSILKIDLNLWESFGKEGNILYVNYTVITIFRVI